MKRGADPCGFPADSAGYNKDQVIPGEWNSIVVPIPADFATSGSKVGVALSATGAGTVQLYVDAITFGS